MEKVTIKSFLGKCWFIGAVYFFIGFSGIGRNSYLDLVFFLGIAIGVCEVFILNNFKEVKVERSMFRSTKAILKAFFYLILVLCCYTLINQFTRIYPEPILFGLLYGTIELISKYIYNHLKNFKKSSKITG